MGIEGIGFNPNIERAGWPACCSHEEAKRREQEAIEELRIKLGFYDFRPEAKDESRKEVR